MFPRKSILHAISWLVHEDLIFEGEIEAKNEARSLRAWDAKEEGNKDNISIKYNIRTYLMRSFQ